MSYLAKILSEFLISAIKLHEQRTLTS